MAFGIILKEIRCTVALVFAFCTLLQARSMTDVEETSPQFLYMKHLHSLIKDSHQRLAENGDKSTTGGNLVATSIEAFEVTGRGIGVNESFQLAGGNTIELELTVPNKKDAGYIIHSAELWLFPDQSQFEEDEDSVLEISFFITADLPHAKQNRREWIVYNWKKNEGCIRLNVTTLSRKIANNLQRKNISKVNISISVEVLGIREISGRAAEESAYEFLDMCATLGDRTSNTPFLAIKYFDENAPFRSLVPNRGGSLQQKRQAVEADEFKPTAHEGCRVKSLPVHLSKIFSSIIAPEIVDLQDCTGMCNSVNHDMFSLHALTKEQIRLATEEEDGHGLRETSCVPKGYEPLQVLIGQENYLVIVEFEDLIVSSCGCL